MRWATPPRGPPSAGEGRSGLSPVHPGPKVSAMGNATASWGVWMCVAAALGGCGPRLTDSPTEFVGDDYGRIGTLCGDDELAAGEQRDYWVKFLTLHHSDYSVDWRGGTLRVEGGVIVRRAAGNPTQQEDGMWARYETYWVQAAPGAKPGDRVTVGPLSYEMSASGRGTRTLTGSRCVARVSG